MRLRRFVLGAALAVVTLTGSANAQSPGAVKAAPRAMESGIAAAKRGDDQTALSEFERAAGLVPNANLPHRYAAEALARLRRYDDAIESFQTYLKIRPSVQDAAEVEQRIEEIRAHYIDGAIDIETKPVNASVSVDDQAVATGTAPIRGLRLRAGTHRLVLRADGYREAAYSVDINAGVRRDVRFTLEPNPSAAPTPAPPASVPITTPATATPLPPPHDRPSSSSHVVSTILFIASGVAVATGIGTAIWADTTASNEKSTVDPVEKPELRDAAYGRAIGADIAIGVAAVLLAGGIVSRLTFERSRSVKALGSSGPLLVTW